jgi:hypothetical protein
MLRIAAVGAAAAFVLTAPVSAGSVKPSNKEERAIHFMYTPQYARQIGRVPNANTGQMEYFGGPVFSKVQVVSVMWGPNVSQATVQGMPGFLKALPNSTFQDQLGEYSTKGLVGVDGHKGTNQTIKRGGFLGQFVITPKNTKTTISNRDIRIELAYQIANGNLPAQNQNNLYMIYFPSNVTIVAFGIQSCSSFGAYHYSSSGHKHSTNVYYGVMPDCGYSFESHTIISAHEFAEATSDNIPTPGTNPKYPQAWNTSDGYEIGDLCQGTSGQLVTKKTTYYVQQVYLNSTAGCSTGNYTSP